MFKKYIYGLINLSLLLFCLLGLVACKSEIKPNEFALELSLKNADNKKLLLYEMKAGAGEHCIDSVLLDKNGNGKLRLTIDTLSLFVLKTPDNSRNQIVLLPDKGEHLWVSADYNSILSSFCVDSVFFVKDKECIYSTSEYIIPFQKNILRKEELNLQIEDYWLSVKDQGGSSIIYDSLVNLLDSIFLVQKGEAIRLASVQTNTLIPIFVAYQSFGNRSLFDLQNDTDINILSVWADEMNTYMPNNPHVKRFKTNMERFKALFDLDKLRKAKENEKNYSK